MTSVDKECATPLIPLVTLKIFRSSNMFNIFNFSVPIPILLPTDTKLGIVDT